MKSSTIRRATLSRESMDVIENLAREQQFEGSSLGEYYRPEDNSENDFESSSKSKEIDLLWQNFKSVQFNTNSPFANLLVGFVAGVLTTLILLACFGMFSSKTPSVSPSTPAVEQTLSEQADEAQEELNNRVSVPGEDDSVQPIEQVSKVEEATPVASSNNTSSMTKYIVKDGDTGEAIIKRHYGIWSEEKMNAIIKVNNLKNLDRLHIDQVLYLP